MQEFPTLVEIGSTVVVDLSLIRDGIPGALVSTIAENPQGTVVGYKMTDGGTIGLVLKLSDGSTNWFFYEEISSKENRNYDLAPKLSHISLDYPLVKIEKIDQLMKKPNVIQMFNPFIFIDWLTFSFKDVI